MRTSNNPAVRAATAKLIPGGPVRVVYRNKHDEPGAERVFIGGLTRAEANLVMAKWGDPKQRFFYMGPGMRVEPCDGTKDGEILKKGVAA